MNKYEKDFPIEVLKLLQHLKNIKDPSVRIEFESKTLITLWDIDPKSNFYFKVVSYAPVRGSFTYTVLCAPASQLKTDEHQKSLSPDEVKTDVKKWIDLVHSYSEYNIFDDPIIAQYQSEFELRFNVDEADDVGTFDFQKQIAIDNYLSQLLLVVEAQDDKSTEIAALKSEIIKLKEIHTSLSIKSVRKRFSRIFAIGRKKSLSLVKEFFELTKKEIMKQVISGGTDLLKDINPF